MRSDSILVGNLIDDLLEDPNLSNFHGIYRFLPVFTEILVKTSFFFHFMHLLGYKTVSCKYESNFMQQFGKIRLPHFA